MRPEMTGVAFDTHIDQLALIINIHISIHAIGQLDPPFSYIASRSPNPSISNSP